MEKVARLCWNTNEWSGPSGRKGKSKSSDSYEKNLVTLGTGTPSRF
jgi:hypothetical protein